MKVKVNTAGFALALSVIVALPSIAHAQETIMAGTVTDPTDAVLPGVTVTALHLASGNTFVGVSDAAGEYRIGALRTGVYKVTAELTGFSTVSRENLELLLGQRAVVNFKLVLSTVQETVTVTGEAPLIDTSQSELSGNIDPRQMQELPVNGRNWLDLTLLAPGSRGNAVTVEAGLAGGPGNGFEINVDGQQVTMLIVGNNGQPQFSRDVIAEFELVSNRFDATQGRSMGSHINAVTKSGTNRYAGTVSGYFRDDRFKAKDFVVQRVLPYSNQQLATTFGGPIEVDKVHFFANYEYEREPQSFAFTSSFPRFNIPPLTGARREDKGGVRIDTQFGSGTRLMVRASRSISDFPYDFRTTGGATFHPSASSWTKRSSGQGFATLTQVFGSNVVHEIKGGYTSYRFDTDGIVPDAPTIIFRGYQMGKRSDFPQNVVQHTYQLRDDLTFVLSGGGRHEVKLGGEAIYNYSSWEPWGIYEDGVISATGGPIPSNIQDLFPVWNDPSTWNLAAISPITIRYQQSFGSGFFKNPRKTAAAWLQDNWATTSRLTLNLGLRYDVSVGSLGEHLTIPPFVPNRRPSETLNFQPRLGFAYTVTDRTVIRGGVGKYFAETMESPYWGMHVSIVKPTIGLANDGRPDFAANPFNGPPPTFEEATRRTGRDMTLWIVSRDYHSPYSWQSSIGLQRQLGQTMAVTSDYVFTGQRRLQTIINQNLSYNPATGGNYPFADISRRPYPDWGSVPTSYSGGRSNYHGLQSAFTKRFSQNWQAAATYTLSALRDATTAPDAGFTVAPDLGGEYALAVGDQRHRAVVNGIAQLPYGFQVSGLYFYGSGERSQVVFGADLRDRGTIFNGPQAGRLRSNGTIIPRNNFVGKPVHRVDVRILRQFPIFGSAKIDGILEVFNLFNHANYGSYVLVESNSRFGNPQPNVNLAYQPRMLQLGFRLAF